MAASQNRNELDRDAWRVELHLFYLQNSFIKKILDSISSQAEEFYV